ncbi:hypothetical protein Taro_027196, partial [Colocasia esculenta]|nr:hypothetical protein [Colocasia esculenta]
MPHSSEPRPGFLEVPGMGLRPCGPQFPTEPVTSEAHPYSPQARARRRFLYRRPVRSRNVAVLAQHLQQCSFSFFSCTCCTLGLVCGIPCEASARSRETNSGQVRYWFNGLGRGVPSQLVSEQ